MVFVAESSSVPRRLSVRWHSVLGVGTCCLGAEGRAWQAAGACGRCELWALGCSRGKECYNGSLARSSGTLRKQNPKWEGSEQPEPLLE